MAMLKKSAASVCAFLLLAWAGGAMAADDPAQARSTSPVTETKIVTPSGATFTNYEAAGNLKSTHNLGCIGLKDASNQYTPADLMKAFSACIGKERYEEAFEAYMLAGSYGAFDRLRVTDKTAHQAVRALMMQHVSALGKEQGEKWQRLISDRLKQDTTQKGLCAQVIRLGPPSYYPTYMIQHGMGAFLEKTKPDIDERFDPKDAWDKVIHQYLQCKS